MTVKTEPRHNAEFLVSEGNNNISREVAGFQPGLMLEPGTVLGKTAEDVYTAVDPAAGDGTETAVAVLLHRKATDASDHEAVIIARLAEVVSSLLVWPDGMTDEDRSTALQQLATRNIIARD